MTHFEGELGRPLPSRRCNLQCFDHQEGLQWKHKDTTGSGSSHSFVPLIARVVSLPNSYVDIITLHVTVPGGRGLKEVGKDGGPSFMGFVSL